MRAFFIAIVLFLWMPAIAVRSEIPSPKQPLLPTANLAREISTNLSPWDPGDPSQDPDPEAFRIRSPKVRDDFERFIVKQINAYPAISPCELQMQLIEAFTMKQDGCNGGLEQEPDGAPRVFGDLFGPASTSRTFVVTYQWLRFFGVSGSETVIEAYVWTKGGGVRRSSLLIPPSFKGMGTYVQRVCWFANPDRYWILVTGQIGGASGRVLGGKAAVYEVGPERVVLRWETQPGIGNIRGWVLPGSFGWGLHYAVSRRVYNDLPKPWMLDIYQIDYEKQTFRRLVHEPVD